MDAATVLSEWNSFCLRYIRASMQAGIEIGFDWNGISYFGTNRKGRQKC
jgi:hypothetical protein